MSLSIDGPSASPVELGLGGLALGLAVWLGWRTPTWAMIAACTLLAIRPQLLWGGPETGYAWDLRHTLIVVALLSSALRYGIRLQGAWPLAALIAIFGLGLTFGELHPELSLPFMLISLAILALPFTFTQVVLEPGSRQRHAMAIACLPALSLAIGACLQLAGVRAVYDPEWTGALRLQGAAGIPAELALLGFAGFAAALHESSRTTNRLFPCLACLNFIVVILSGTRMALAASIVLVIAYVLLFTPVRTRLREGRTATTAGIGVVVLVAILYLPNLWARTLADDGGGMLGLQMSGRDAIWSFYGGEVLTSPWFGRGMGAGFIAYAEHTDFALPTPHNEYLHILVVGGIAGLTLWLAAIALWFRSLVRTYRWDDRAFFYALILALAMYCATENTLILPSALPIFVYLGVMRTRSMRDLAPEAPGGARPVVEPPGIASGPAACSERSRGPLYGQPTRRWFSRRPTGREP